MSYLDSLVYQCPVWRLVCIKVVKMGKMVDMVGTMVSVKIVDFRLNG